VFWVLVLLDLEAWFSFGRSFCVLVHFFVFIKTFISSTQGYGKPLFRSPLDAGDRHSLSKGSHPAQWHPRGDAYRVLRAGRASLASPEGLQKAESRGLAMPHGQWVQVGTHHTSFPSDPDQLTSSPLSQPARKQQAAYLK